MGIPKLKVGDRVRWRSHKAPGAAGKRPSGLQWEHKTGTVVYVFTSFSEQPRVIAAQKFGHMIPAFERKSCLPGDVLVEAEAPSPSSRHQRRPRLHYPPMIWLEEVNGEPVNQIPLEDFET